MCTGIKDLNLTIGHFDAQINTRILTAVLLTAEALRRMKEFCISNVEEPYCSFTPVASHPDITPGLHEKKSSVFGLKAFHCVIVYR